MQILSIVSQLGEALQATSPKPATTDPYAFGVMDTTMSLIYAWSKPFNVTAARE